MRYSKYEIFSTKCLAAWNTWEKIFDGVAQNVFVLELILEISKALLSALIQGLKCAESSWLKRYYARSNLNIAKYIILGIYSLVLGVYPLENTPPPGKYPRGK
jgi:hypothetical protein